MLKCMCLFFWGTDREKEKEKREKGGVLKNDLRWEVYSEGGYMILLGGNS